MASRYRNISRDSIFTSLLILGIIVLLIPHSHTKVINEVFESTFREILSMGPRENPWLGKFEQTKGSSVSKEKYARLQSEYQRVRKEHANTLAQLRESHRRFEQLSGMQSKLPDVGSGLSLSQIVNSRLNGNRRELIINRGRDTGLRPGQYVIGNDAMIGILAEVAESTSRVRLVTDSQQNTEVLIRSEGSDKNIRAQLFGDGAGKCKIKLLPREHKVRENDLVYAANDREFLETPVVIGYIEKVTPDEQKPLLWDITVEPFFDVDDLDEVAVIVMQPDILGQME
ncbi:rod shape-determining protein MreC [Anaerohalosphaera lusitana]|uniref:Cell shape-determining protein MreC n=1 Tax=Anaerohalosphaera lusitana TaxID=1936003 RepID=A0A1U9NQU5_9BACT|nr:rod shape-determining protein MreC [Anaerohalosphaera lusitana]AQT70114.1 rod shape-determining protein MreC [Anaerohalosphaera lusitana]